MLLGVVTIPAIINVGIGYVTRDQVVDRVEIVTYRDYVGVSSALLLFVALVAPDVICPDRRQRVLPLMFARPLTGCRLRRRQGRGDRHDPVRLLVPAPGRAVRRQHARQRQRPRRTSRGTSTCCGRCPSAVAPAGRVLRRRSASPSPRSPTGGSSPARPSSGCSSSRRSPRGSSSARSARTARSAAAAQRPGPAAVPARRRVPRPHRPDESRSAGWPTAGCSPSALYVVVARRGHRRAAVALPVGGAMTRRPPPPPSTPPPTDPAFAADADGRDRRRLGVVRRQGRAVRAELLVRSRRHRPARPERRRQDDADAGDDRHDRRQPGPRAASTGSDPRRDRSVHRAHGARARGRGRARPA